MKKSVILLAFIFCLAPSYAFGSGLEIEPSELNIKFSPGQKAYGELRVKNPAVVPQNFEVYADTHTDAVKIGAAEFTLAPGQERIINIEALKGVNTKLSIVATPHSRDSLSASVGIKIPLRARGENPLLPRDTVEWMIYTIAIFGSLFLLSLHPDIKNKYTSKLGTTS